MNKTMAKKPMGPSMLGDIASDGFGWNNLMKGTDGPVICELCGKAHPYRKDQTYTISKFLGKEIVEECCGAVLDKVYKESGEFFALAFLEEFANDPSSSRFHTLINTLERIIPKAKQGLSKTEKLEEIKPSLVSVIFHKDP